MSGPLLDGSFRGKSTQPMENLERDTEEGWLLLNSLNWRQSVAVDENR